MLDLTWSLLGGWTGLIQPWMKRPAPGCRPRDLQQQRPTTAPSARSPFIRAPLGAAARWSLELCWLHQAERLKEKPAPTLASSQGAQQGCKLCRLLPGACSMPVPLPTGPAFPGCHPSLCGHRLLVGRPAVRGGSPEATGQESPAGRGGEEAVLRQELLKRRGLPGSCPQLLGGQPEGCWGARQGQDVHQPCTQMDSWLIPLLLWLLC